jgi:hypothetical protein
VDLIFGEQVKHYMYRYKYYSLNNYIANAKVNNEIEADIIYTVQRIEVFVWKYTRRQDIRFIKTINVGGKDL